MNNNAKGVSLIELLVAIAIAGILAVIAFPSFQQWRQNLEYKEAARDVASVLRDARSRAIARNLEHRVEFDAANRQYRMTRQLAAGSTDFNTVIKNWGILPVGVNMNDNCAANRITFNPNGTSNGCTINIQDTTPTTKYNVIVATTGRVRIN